MKTAVLITLFSVLIFPEIRYVSKTGSSTPPFTSWETSADSIMECINISNFGDTIYVGNGVYKEVITMIPGLSLIGSGIDSCTIDTRDFATPTDFFAVTMQNECKFKNIRIVVSNWTYRGTGILVDFYSNNIEIKNNIIENCVFGVYILHSNISLKNNFIDAAEGVFVDGNSGNFYPVIDSNYFIIRAHGIKIFWGSTPTIRGNIINITEGYSKGYTGSASDSAFVYNNLIMGNYKYAYGLNPSFIPTKLYNNLVIECSRYGILCGNNNYVKNNIITKSTNGITNHTSQFPIIQYNGLWGNERDFYIYNKTADSTNIIAGPMFDNEDSLDFHLQMYSPLIDAGDPDILDKDGSRSDIGLFGGPFGEKYTYRDLAPRPPKNLSAVYENKSITLTWNKNTETDFSHYHIYRDTVPDFMYDSSKIIAVTTDTIYLDNVNNLKLSPEYYYYKITSWDSTSHQSAPGNEVSVLLTGQAEIPPKVIEEYKLLNNYPNPFNPQTTIPYVLKESGYVKLVIYNMLGERVKVLVNGYKEKGYHETEFIPTAEEKEKGKTGSEYWTGYNDDIATGIYIYRIDVKNENNIPVYVKSGKMILLK